MIKVKPLKWYCGEQHMRDGVPTREHWSKNYINNYVIFCYGDKANWRLGSEWKTTECPTLEEAKQACFEHWSNIVLSAIEEE